MVDTKNSSAAKVMPITGHMRELQIRLTISVVIFITAACLAYIFRDQIIHLLMSPLNGQRLTYLNPSGGFTFIMLVSVYAGLAVAAPIVIQQIYGFIKPILSEKFQKKSISIFCVSLVLLAAGISFGYVFAIPGALNFLYTFAGDYVDAALTADSYLNFIVAYTLGIGLVFQLPLILMLIHWIKPLTPSGLLKSERWVILLAFIAAALITPTPDPLNQVIIAIPIILIYQLGVGAVIWSIYKDRRMARRAEAKQMRKAAAETAVAQKAKPKPQPQLAHANLVKQTQPSVAIEAKNIARQPSTARSIDFLSKPKSGQMSSKNLNQPIAKTFATTAAKRLDGFVTNTQNQSRQTNRAVSVPIRPQLSKQIAPTRPSNYRSSLSLDGMTRTRVI